jgi:hypothetical protein
MIIMVGFLYACIILLQVTYCMLFAFTGGSSHPPGPNFGVIIISPALFLKGFENVHKDFPREGSQAGLKRVKPAREGQRRISPWAKNLTFKPNLICPYNLVVYDVIGWW